MSGYTDHGFTDSRPSHSFNYLRGPLLALLNKDINRTILDLGCGNGHLANYLIAQGFNVYGTDASEAGIAIAKAENPDRFFLQDLSTDKLPNELQQIKFDTIISTEVIEHLYDAYGFVIFCREALNNKGQLIISTPYHGYLKNLVLSIFDKWDGHHDSWRRGGHIKFWSKKTLSQLLIKTGFKVTDFKGCGRLPYFWKSMIIKAELT
jgi:2-polyprenyl-3-methyl-5-hydroxy-6-metoxy-1,4-benzoquinol methylase